MLKWCGYTLCYNGYLLVDVIRFGRRDIRLNLRGWDDFGMCDYPYKTMREAKAAGETWARARGIPLVEQHVMRDRNDDSSVITDDDIPF